MFTQLVATKYRSPPLTSGRILRLNLLHRLDDALQMGRRLVLVSAPAGYGKTTLLLQWVAHRREGAHDRQTGAGKIASDPALPELACAWLTLDAADNNPLQFLAYFVASIEFATHLTGAITSEGLQALDPAVIPSLLPVLANDIAGTAIPIAVVLDDYHEIASQEVHGIVSFLIRYAPAMLHFVISSRVDPPLPLAQLRGRNQMSEIRQQDLRFTSDEARQLFDKTLAPSLRPGLVELLNERTEGWVAGLQMAAISLQGHRDPDRFVQAFSGSHRHILDYLSEEVFNSQPPTIQTFLMRTSILDRLCAALCHALFCDLPEIDDAQAILDKLEQDNLFMVALDDQRCWYRYHHLF